MSAGRRVLLVGLFATCQLLAFPLLGASQSSTYYLHKETGSNFGTFALSTASPHAGTLVRQSGDMKGRPPSLMQTLGLWTSPVGSPQASGVIPADRVVTITLWMRKTSAFGVVYPSASVQTVESLDVNYQAKAHLCAGTGTTALDTTLRAYTFTCSTESVSMASTDRFAVFAGYSMTQGPGNKSMIVELHIEGAANSRAVLPLPDLPPSISSLTPPAAAAGELVTIAGANFGAAQGSSTVQFNGIAATPASWGASTITAPVPAGATSGPVVVTVNGFASTAAAFSVITPPGITALTPSVGSPNQTITISGSNFGAAQGTSTVAFDGVIAATTNWSEANIAAVVPPGATTGPVVVTVGGRISNALVFTIIPPPTLGSINPTFGSPGETVTLSGQNLGPGAATVTFNGTPAAITDATTTSITATVPAHATSGPVVVTLDGQASNGLPFTVLSDAPATLTVEVYEYDELAPGHQGPPAGAGLYVRVDGVDVGRTLQDGTLTVEVSAGERSVTAIEPSTAMGAGSITLSPGGSATLSIVLEDGKDVVESTELIVVENLEGIVPVASTTFTMRFLEGTTVAPVTKLNDVELLGRAGNIIWSLKSMFTISNGDVIATDPVSMFYWLPWNEPVVLRVEAVDANGFSHEGAVRFSMGQFTLALTLSPPPSNPALPVAGLDVDVTVPGTSIVLRRTSDALGKITIPALPHATAVVSSTAMAGGSHYYGWSTLTLAADTSATLILRNVVDVINDVPPLTMAGALQGFPVLSSTAARSPIRSRSDAAVQEMLDTRAAAQWAMPSARPASSISVASTLDPGEPVTLTVTSWGADEPVHQNATLTVAQGTKKVVLKYNVTSLEYPEWVRQQSPFDDVWSLSVYGGPGGAQLFHTWRNVNSQASGEPAWQGDSSTGEMQEEFDVTELAANGDIQLVMAASAVNIRDHLFNTTVNAELGGTGTLKINSVKKDVVEKTRSASQYVSIPRLGAKNHHPRLFTLQVTKPKPETKIEKVRVALRSGAGATLQTLFEAVPGGDDVTAPENNGATDTVKVRITMHTMDSQVQSTPPTTHFIRYRFEVQADVDGELQWSEPKDSEELVAFWRMPGPGVFHRFPANDRDVGFDDWATRGAYDWLSQNAALFANTSINDISGEHAYDIGHTQHAHGVEIDIFHFKKFAGAYNAASNYRLLRGHVLAGLDGNQSAKDLVKQWVTATRAGFDPLIALPQVEKLYTTVGTQFKVAGVEVLPEGWGEQLIKKGILSVGAKSLDLEIGEWANQNSAKMKFNQKHDDHGHITLNQDTLSK